jgi:hypothetical protein
VTKLNKQQRMQHSFVFQFYPNTEKVVSFNEAAAQQKPIAARRGRPNRRRDQKGWQFGRPPPKENPFNKIFPTGSQNTPFYPDQQRDNNGPAENGQTTLTTPQPTGQFIPQANQSLSPVSYPPPEEPQQRIIAHPFPRQTQASLIPAVPHPNVRSGQGGNNIPIFQKRQKINL